MKDIIILLALMIVTFAAYGKDFELKSVRYNCRGDLKVKVGGVPMATTVFDMTVQGSQRMDLEVEGDLLTFEPNTYRDADINIGSENLFLSVNGKNNATLIASEFPMTAYWFYVAQTTDYIYVNLYDEKLTLPVSLRGSLRGHISPESVNIALRRASDNKKLYCEIRAKKGFRIK